MLKRLLDSVILIDHFNNIQKATKFVLDLDPKETAISVISRAEILAGFAEDESKFAKSLMDQYALLTIEKDIADEAARWRRMQGWKLPDAFQAALAIHHHIKISTRNTKDFNPLKHHFVEIPYKLR